jgi:tetratricopeptide (TPR) repeat protein
LPGEYRFVFGLYLPDSGTYLATPDDPRGAIDLGWRLVSVEDVSNQVLIRHGWEQLECDKLEEARGAFEAVLVQDRDNVDALLGANAVYAAQGDRERTAQIAERLLPLIPNPQDVPLGDVMRFIGYEIQSSGDTQVRVDLYFQAMTSTDAEYNVWMHAYVHKEDIALIPQERQQYGSANLDHRMDYPTSRLIEGGIYRDRIEREMLSAEYRFEFGLYLHNSGARLTTPGNSQGSIDLGWHVVSGE